MTEQRACKKDFINPENVRNFTLTVPTTPLNDAYHGGNSAFYKLMNYYKQPIDFARQIELLKERGMQFPDEKEALGRPVCEWLCNNQNNKYISSRNSPIHEGRRDYYEPTN